MRLRNGNWLSLLFTSLMLCLSPGWLRAQTFNLQSGREPVASLDGLWRFHTGDYPAWATPDFDDSKLPLLRSDEERTRQRYKEYSGYAWNRFQVVVPSGEGDLSLLLPPILNSYQAFMDVTLDITRRDTEFIPHLQKVVSLQ